MRYIHLLDFQISYDIANRYLAKISKLLFAKLQKNNQKKKVTSSFIKQKFRPGSLFYGKRGGNCRCTGSANRMKFQKYLRISEMQPTFNFKLKVVQLTTERA